jgi:hypothetical protein
MVQVPALTKLAVLLLTVQTLVVFEVKLTVKPELAVAESVSGVPTVWVPGVLNVIVCASFARVTVAEPVRFETAAWIVTLVELGMVVGAVNKPAVLIVPAEAVHFTPAVFDVNCCVLPSTTVTVEGEIEIEF